MSLVDDIDALLPQTQCRECGFDGCRPYAEALARGLAPLDQCPPGGVATAKALGELLHKDVTPLLADLEANTRQPSLALIREAECIGCTKCIQACPVDAIVGSAKAMHSILTHECTGCGLCVAPCPVDCIEMVAVSEPRYDKSLARKRHQARAVRQMREADEKARVYREKRQVARMETHQQPEKEAKKAYILAALQRVQTKS